MKLWKLSSLQTKVLIENSKRMQVLVFGRLRGSFPICPWKCMPLLGFCHADTRFGLHTALTNGLWTCTNPAEALRTSDFRDHLLSCWFLESASIRSPDQPWTSLAQQVASTNHQTQYRDHLNLGSLGQDSRSVCSGELFALVEMFCYCALLPWPCVASLAEDLIFSFLN